MKPKMKIPVRVLGRVFSFKKARFKVVESSTGFVSERGDPFWCRLTAGEYQGFEIGDEVTLPLKTILGALGERK